MNRTTIIALQQYLKEKIKLNDNVNEYVDINFPSNLINMTGQSLKNKLEIFDKIVTGSQKINRCDHSQRNLVYCWVVSTVNGQKEVYIGSSCSPKGALSRLVTYYKRFQLVWDRQKKEPKTLFSQKSNTKKTYKLINNCIVNSIADLFNDKSVWDRIELSIILSYSDANRTEGYGPKGKKHGIIKLENMTKKYLIDHNIILCNKN